MRIRKQNRFVYLDLDLSWYGPGWRFWCRLRGHYWGLRQSWWDHGVEVKVYTCYRCRLDRTE